MKSPLTLLVTTLLFLALFTGCTQKIERMACFKGSSACFSQAITPHKNQNCPTCRAIL